MVSVGTDRYLWLQDDGGCLVAIPVLALDGTRPSSALFLNLDVMQVAGLHRDLIPDWSCPVAGA